MPVFVAVGRDGFIATSPDGRSWTPRSSGTTAHLNRVGWCEDAFVAVGEAGTVLSSATGVDWSPLTSGAINSLYMVAGDGQSLLVGGRTGMLLYGEQTATGWGWAQENRSVRNWLWEATRTPDFYLAVGDRGNILTSTDGARWNLEWVPDALTNSIFLSPAPTPFTGRGRSPERRTSFPR